ncbi:amidase [Micromonospora pallida]|uniref:Amidase n=1 Tax=Micromonospora pallida TaxID=145854 RepID=A0A1C6T5G2_9ACTN|nr:amidase family protein [Micromonospora pallida]SCL37018.1 amidase [Micromonospora pallida]
MTSTLDPLTSTDVPLHWWSAVALRDAMVAGDLSAVEVMNAFYDRIEELNAEVNVIVHRLPRAECVKLAEEADRARARGDELGVLHGLPTAVKDLVDVAGMPTSRGSRRFANGGPATTDAPHVAHMRAAGALIIGKTNSPEFGVGTVTFNDVFGVTRNPWDLTRHAGGSSGGAAAVAAGMLPICDGSDSGGSLRYPAAFCNIVGLRTTPGLVPAVSAGTSWSPHSVNGPMARTCADTALTLAGMSGRHRLAPLSNLRAEPAGVPTPDRAPRVGWSTDLGGLPVTGEVATALAQARARLEAAGVEVVDVDLDTDGLDRCWQVIEMFGWFTLLGRHPIEHPELYRDDFVVNVTEAAGYTTTDLADALHRRYAAFEQMARVLDGLDGLITPSAPVVAPNADLPWVPEIDGTTFDRYFLWQRMACRLVPSAHPVLAMGAGFDPQGLPVGLQVVGHHGADGALLTLGERLEPALGVAGLHPRI